MFTTTTERVAAVVGATLVLATTSETINLHIWSENDPTLVYLNGLFLLAAGLVVLVVHFDWTSVRCGLVSVSGCLLFVAGSIRMFFPTAEQLAPGPVTYGIIATLCVYGLVLCAIAISGGRAQEAQQG